jgi:hypothetical protein
MSPPNAGRESEGALNRTQVSAQATSDMKLLIKLTCARRMRVIYWLYPSRGAVRLSAR